jgi:hypothetical protein
MVQRREKSCPCQELNHDHPAHSSLLYRLRYLVSVVIFMYHVIQYAYFTKHYVWNAFNVIFLVIDLSCS